MSTSRAAMLSTIHDVLSRTEGVRLALLFGSIARESFTDDSDVDVAIDAQSEVDLLTVAAELGVALGREVDIVALGDAGVPLLDELIRDGIVAYEGGAHAAARWRAHVLADLELDRPWYGRMRDAWLLRVASRGLTDGQS